MSELTFGYVKTPLFENLSFKVGPGDLVHIKGPNGTGKSTLLSVVAGLLQPDAGNIELSGQISTEYLPAEGSGHYLKLDARQNLEFWLRLHGRELNDHLLLEEMRFWRLNPVVITNRVPVEQYSTGMKRKLALARVRLCGAHLWFLDEPVSGLDDHALEQFSSMLRSHLDAGGSAMIISHDTNPIRDLVTNTLAIGS